ncbi:MAG: YqgE/AlgH family protein [Muribaculaceae bacterium]|nr:YqgE/AlgH family protein [Muribaculaceae bacterium]
MINFDSILFNIDISDRLPQAGSILVAEPFLREQYFNHAAICLIEYEVGQPAMGVVMNRSTGYMLSDLMDIASGGSTIPVYCGGPLSCDRLYFLHSLGDILPDSRQVTDRLWVGGDFDTMRDYIASGYPTDGHVRFFIGYSGWDAGQLESELHDHVWAVTDIPNDLNPLVGSDDAYWHRMVRYMGSDFRGWRYHPQNPHAN